MKRLKKEWSYTGHLYGDEMKLSLFNKQTGETRSITLKVEDVLSSQLSRKALFKDCFETVVKTCKTKESALSVWRYLRDHPEIDHKTDLPPALWSIIEKEACNCPLCTVFGADQCTGCPLIIDGFKCCSFGHPFSRWDSQYSSERDRAEAAAEIVRLIESWEVK